MPYADNSLKDENRSFSEHESKVHSFQKLKDTKSQLIQAITFKHPGDIKVHFKHTLRSPGFSYYPTLGSFWTYVTYKLLMNL